MDPKLRDMAGFQCISEIKNTDTETLDFYHIQNSDSECQKQLTVTKHSSLMTTCKKNT